VLGSLAKYPSSQPTPTGTPAPAPARVVKTPHQTPLDNSPNRMRGSSSQKIFVICNHPGRYAVLELASCSCCDVRIQRSPVHEMILCVDFPCSTFTVIQLSFAWTPNFSSSLPRLILLRSHNTTIHVVTVQQVPTSQQCLNRRDLMRHSQRVLL
jgi:hypothetical protein